MPEGEDDGEKGAKPNPEQQLFNGFKKVVVGVCVMEKKVGERSSWRRFVLILLWLFNSPTGVLDFKFSTSPASGNWILSFWLMIELAASVVESYSTNKLCN